MKKSLPIICDSNTRVLIVGTAPGEQSLKEEMYYSNKSNRFWKIIFSYLQTDDPKDYNTRISYLKKNGIGLWDAYYTFKRNKSSRDKDIKESVLNDFSCLPENIKLIICNGNEPFKKLRKAIVKTDKIIVPCYSTSSTHRNISEIELKNEWAKMLNLAKTLSCTDKSTDL